MRIEPMRTIDVFLQGDGVTDIQVLAIAPQDTIANVLSMLGHSESTYKNLLVFLEDVAAPLDKDAVIEELLPLPTEEDVDVGSVRLHLSHCHRLEVIVRFNGENEKRHFPPSATVERVRRWAVHRAFNMSPIDAAEHVLQLQNSTLRPDRDVHIGTLTVSDTCMVAFDLVPSKRVEG
jgi:hypothetical protein